MLNVFLMTDLEGIADVTDIGFMARGSEKYVVGCSGLERSINLAVKACFEAGCEQVYYLDGHGGGGNVNPAMIDSRAEKCDIASWHTLLREGKIDCQIELGAHARAGTLGGFLDHTMFSDKWFSHRVNGVEMSELSMHALLCAAYGVRVVGCTGDKTACEQAQEYIPKIFTGTMKRALCRNQSVINPDADRILYDMVLEAVKGCRSVPLMAIPSPLDVELTFYRTDMCEDALSRAEPGVLRVDARTLRRTVRNLTDYSQLCFF